MRAEEPSKFSSSTQGPLATSEVLKGVPHNEGIVIRVHIIGCGIGPQCSISEKWALDASSAHWVDEIDAQVPPSPCFAELLELAAVSGVSLRLILVSQAQEIIGLALCYVERQIVGSKEHLIYRMFGGQLHDYSRLYVRNIDAMNSLLRAIRLDAKCCKADVLRLNGLIFPNEDWFFPRLSTTYNLTMAFDVRRSKNGWEGIRAKRSLRRHWNRAKALPGFRVEHRLGNVTQDDITRIARMHRERWSFEGQKSPFQSPNRLDEYLVHPSNKMLTYVYLGDELLCAHFGMVYENVLLWHTPVINIKYLELSPLEVLLAATAKYCSEASLSVLDLGQGNEEYKKRFSNTSRKVFSIVTPLSLRAILPIVLERLFFVLRNSDTLRPVRTRLASVKRYLTSIRGFLRVAKSTLIWFESERSDPPTPLQVGLSLSIIRSYTEYVDFCRKYALVPLKIHYQRYKDRCFFVALHDAMNAYSFGWATNRADFFVAEIRRSFPLAGRIMLFDFYSPEQHRGKGYYTSLLRCIRASCFDGKLAIFALESNVASVQGICRAGFEKKASYLGICGLIASPFRWLRIP